MKPIARIVPAIVSVLMLGAMGSVPAVAQIPVLNAQFTQTPITVDGVAETAWDAATPVNIAICKDNSLVDKTDCATSGIAKAMWDGAVLYLLFDVTDPTPFPSGGDTTRDGVEIFVDQYNDKFPKFQEDDCDIRISAGSVQTGNSTNAGITTYNTAWFYHLKSYKAATRTGGYIVEVAWEIGDRPMQNGAKIGMEFVINDATASGKRTRRLFWAGGYPDKGMDNNSGWGEVALAGLGDTPPTELNKFMLNQNVIKGDAAASTPGVWLSVTELTSALAAAKAAQSATTQVEVDSANTALDAALRNLHRAGKYPDPYELPEVAYLPDPFTFLDGSKVRSLADWARRRAEIKDMAQYYEFGYIPAKPATLTATSSGTGNTKTITITMAEGGSPVTFKPTLYLPTTGTRPYPVIVSIGSGSNSTFTAAGYAILSIPVSIASDNDKHTGAFFSLYPYSVATGLDSGVLMAWGWGASRGVDALEYLTANDSTYAGLVDLNKLVVQGFSRYGKAALVAGLLDERFKVVSPGGSGCGGAAPYRYDSFGNRPYRTTFGNVYWWGQSPGAEVMGDHGRHQVHNSNEMFRRFLNDTVPAAVVPRMYQTNTPGYGARMPFDHHLEIAAIAPRAVLINNTNDDYADNAEGDAIGYEAAKPVYQFLGASQNLGLDIYMGGGGHSFKTSQAQNLVAFASMVLSGVPLSSTVEQQVYTDPFLTGSADHTSIYDQYYGGFASMMPWLSDAPHANLLASLTASAGTLSPVFDSKTFSYSMTVANSVSSIQFTPVSEDVNAATRVNGVLVVRGEASQAIPLDTGANAIEVAVTSYDGVSQIYNITVNRKGTVQLTATVTLVKLGDGSYSATVKIANKGTGTAQNVHLTAGTLGGQAGSPIPQSLGDILPSGFAATTVNFPASAGASGTRVAVQFSATHADGTFNTTLRAVLP